jgi:hypothetical protein
VGNKTLMLDGVGDVSLCLKSMDKDNSFGILTIPDCYYLKTTKHTLLSTCQLEDLGFAVRLLERDIVNLSTGESICAFERRGRVLVLRLHQDQIKNAVPITGVPINAKDKSVWTKAVQNFASLRTQQTYGAMQISKPTAESVPTLSSDQKIAEQGNTNGIA